MVVLRQRQTTGSARLPQPGIDRAAGRSRLRERCPRRRVVGPVVVRAPRETARIACAARRMATPSRTPRRLHGPHDIQRGSPSRNQEARSCRRPDRLEQQPPHSCLRARPRGAGPVAHARCAGPRKLLSPSQVSIATISQHTLLAPEPSRGLAASRGRRQPRVKPCASGTSRGRRASYSPLDGRTVALTQRDVDGAHTASCSRAWGTTRRPTTDVPRGLHRNRWHTVETIRPSNSRRIEARGHQSEFRNWSGAWDLNPGLKVPNTRCPVRRCGFLSFWTRIRWLPNATSPDLSHFYGRLLHEARHPRPCSAARSRINPD